MHPNRIACFASLFLIACHSTPASEKRVFLWAWDRPERLGFIDPQTTGVAWLVATVKLIDGQLRLEPRHHPISMPAYTEQIAVFRIELPSAWTTRGQASAVAERVLSVVPAEASGVQIDFDARQSQQPFYAQLLSLLRRELAPGLSLSIAGLASWCSGGNDWLQSLPIDYAVPMVYRMGPDTERIRARVEAHRNPWRSQPCQGQLGLSSDEWIKPAALPASLFLFHAQVWTEHRYDQLQQQSR